MSDEQAFEGLCGVTRELTREFLAALPPSLAADVAGPPVATEGFQADVEERLETFWRLSRDDVKERNEMREEPGRLARRLLHEVCDDMTTNLGHDEEEALRERLVEACEQFLGGNPLIE
jgi:hypothetical protein